MPINEVGLRKMREDAKSLAASLTEEQQAALVLECCAFVCAAEGDKFMEAGLWDKHGELRYQTVRVAGELNTGVKYLAELLRACAERRFLNA